MNNPLDKYMTRVQSGSLIGCILMAQFFTMIYSHILDHHHSLGIVSALVGIVGLMFFCLAVIVKVFITDYREDDKQQKEIKE